MDGQKITAIELQGINRHETKIGVKDGQTEDLLNMRFRDGSWRMSGDGKRVFSFQNGVEYVQMYIHTNVYRHLLGVRAGALWWFADIEADGVFTERETPERLTEVSGDLWITQTGHLLTVIDRVDDFEYFVFHSSEDKYVHVVVDENGKQTDRGLYPFGQVHFNVYSPSDNDDYIIKQSDVVDTFLTECEGFSWGIEKMKERNKFTQPFLAIAAIKLYDGSYVHSSNPIYISPRERLNNIESDGNTFLVSISHVNDNYVETESIKISHYDATGDQEVMSAFPFAPFADVKHDSNLDYSKFPAFLGSDLCLTITGDKNFLSKNGNIFQSLCIFVTRQINTRPTSLEELRENVEKFHPQMWGSDKFLGLFSAKRFKKEDSIIHDLINSPFYLLREYDSKEIDILNTNPIVDLTDIKYDMILKDGNLLQQPRLNIEASNRLTYLPKYSYNYNGRLHIANYKTHQFHGYPIDLFHLHNHSVNVEGGSWFKGVLSNLADNNDDYLQYAKTEYKFMPLGDYFAFISVEIETNDGTQRVVRYIKPYSIDSAESGRADFVESLNPLITFPDYRAKKMVICVLGRTTSNMLFYRELDLQPHPLYNFAYYIQPNLKPISFLHTAVIDKYTLPDEQNVEEYYPNGLKVTSTDNPLIFPVENTYQIGSSEIVALCANAVAVGTGQTGSAPLYVFTKDGVYALFVDATGEMTYTNARILSRDVCNNGKSVTPIDDGVVFTTDRGLMAIAGEKVQEIGQPAEGDVLQYAKVGDAGYIKIAAGALTQVAGLPDTLCDTDDFLTYIQGAVINYNHNERELMVSNPQKNYSYILDREGNWMRRDYSASEYVNNFPTSYRVEDGVFYKVDEEETGRDTADNQFFFLTQPIKLGSIGFKESHRFVARGYFETLNDKPIGCYVFGSYDGRRWAMLGGNERKGKITDIGCKIERTDVKFLRVCMAGQLSKDSRLDYMEISSAPSVLNKKIR